MSRVSPPTLPPHHLLVDSLRETLERRPRRRIDIQSVGLAPEFRPAAVALLLRDVDGTTWVPVTRRAESLRQHSGQISLPGGVRDLTDDSPATTALRETFEELGIEPERIEVLGSLDDVVTPTGFVITPVVAALRGDDDYRPNPREVAEAFEVPLQRFLDPSCKEELGTREIGGRSYRVIAYHVGGHSIWGATARIFEMLIAKLLPPPQPSP